MCHAKSTSWKFDIQLMWCGCSGKSLPKKHKKALFGKVSVRAAGAFIVGLFWCVWYSFETCGNNVSACQPGFQSKTAVTFCYSWHSESSFCSYSHYLVQGKSLTRLKYLLMFMACLFKICFKKQVCKIYKNPFVSFLQNVFYFQVVPSPRTIVWC